ncbi:helix-turn-helix transcriptional regulator [Streptomyces sp. f51]|uniref:helix-turn-helix transcriptional regulator n=1 Tax=Streptomyces sp. f51 TaxID=1827742 RepID=UPI000BF0F012|nr:LuxR family transcriptional regulator [Streptomyces sp. f51]
MAGGNTTPWERRLRQTLAGEIEQPVLFLVAGAAGTGKTWFARRLLALARSLDVLADLRSCGESTAPGGQDARYFRLVIHDDVHRAGLEEVALLRESLARLGPGRAVVLLYRPEELVCPGLPLGSPPLDYPSTMSLLQHTIPAWDLEKVRAVATKTLDRCVAPEMASRLLAASGGVAQVVTDMLSGMRDRSPHATTTVEPDRAEVPLRLKELTLARLAALPARHQAVVRAAAVLNEPATRQELLEVAAAGMYPRDSAPGSQDRWQGLLRGLESAVLREYEHGRYGLFVPLASRVVRDVTPGPLRQEMHAVAADLLARRSPKPHSLLAHHLREAGRYGEWIRAAERAARRAVKAGRYEEAVSLLEEVVASPDVAVKARAGLAPLLADSAVLGLRVERTVDVLSLIVADGDLPLALRGEIRLVLGLLLINQLGQVEDGYRETARAAAELLGERPCLAARAMAALAMPHWPGIPIGTHRAWIDEAEAAARNSGDPVALSAVRANTVALAMSAGEPRGWDLLRILPTGHPDRKVRRHAARGLCNAADAAVWLGRFEQAEELLASASELARSSGLPYSERSVNGASFLLDYFAGRWNGLAERCTAFAADHSHLPVVNGDARLVLGLLALARGEWSRAMSYLSDPEPLPLASHVTTAAGAGIRLLLARDDVGAAAGEARRAWNLATVKGVWVWAAELAPWVVEALVREGAVEEAAGVVRELAAGTAGADAPAASAHLLHGRALVAEAARLPAEAAGLYRASAEAFGCLPRPYDQALCRERAALLVLGGEKEGCRHAAPASRERTQAVAEAVAELELCVEDFESLGASWDATRTRAELRRHQPATSSRPGGRPSFGGLLSPREEEVAELAASGLTNREIATTLHLSPRTVEHHVARAVHKLGALSRQDLARRRMSAQDAS